MKEDVSQATERHDSITVGEGVLGGYPTRLATFSPDAAFLQQMVHSARVRCQAELLKLG